MQGLSLGSWPAGVAALNAAKSTLRVVVSAYFLAAGVAYLIDPLSGAPLGGFFPSDIVVGVLFVCGAALLLNTLVRLSAMVLSVFLMLSACANLGLAGAGAPPDAFWMDVIVLAAICLTGLFAERTTLRIRRVPGAPRAPSGPRKASLSPDYAKALRNASDRWDRDAA